MKRFLKLLWISLLLFGGMVSALPSFADAYTTGLSAYQQGNYPVAVKSLEKAVQLDPNDPKKIFYLGLAYAQNQNYAKARASFEEISKMVPPTSPLAVKARNNMNIITQAQMATQGNADKANRLASTKGAAAKNNYLAYAIPEGKVVHWDPQKMPLRVYITDGTGVEGWESSMKGLVLNAMGAWQAATKNRIRFKATNQLSQADIVVRWKKSFPHDKVGENPFERYGKTIVRSDITIATQVSNRGISMPADEMQRTILHELGHALGIQGHSPYPEDIMYFSINPQQGNSLSLRDMNTLNMLYAMDADVQNSPTMTTAQTQKYYGVMEKAVKSQVGQNPAQAIRYYQQALAMNPYDPDLYFNLGVALQDSGNPSQAMASYRKALSLDKKRVDVQYNLAILLVNEGAKLANTGKPNPARQNFQEAVVLFEGILNSPKAPAETKKNLEIAKKNLVQVNS